MVELFGEVMKDKEGGRQVREEKALEKKESERTRKKGGETKNKKRI